MAEVGIRKSAVLKAFWTILAIRLMRLEIYVFSTLELKP